MFKQPKTTEEKSNFLKIMGYAQSSIDAATASESRWNEFYNDALSQVDRFYTHGPAKSLGQYANASNPDALNKASSSQATADKDNLLKSLAAELDPTKGSLPVYAKKYADLQAAGFLEDKDIDQFNSLLSEVQKYTQTPGLSLLQGGSGKAGFTTQNLIGQVTGETQAVNKGAGVPTIVPPTPKATSTKGLSNIAKEIVDKLNFGFSANQVDPLSAAQRLVLEKQFFEETGSNDLGLAPGTPMRSAYPAGPAGDQQYEAAVEKLNAQLSSKEFGLEEANSLIAASDWINRFQGTAMEEVAQDSAVPTRTNSDTSLSSEESYFQNILSGGGSSQASTPSTTTGTPSSSSAPAFNAEQKLSELRSQYDIDPLEAEISDLDRQIREIEDTYKANQNLERGKPVALGVMGGRISTEEQQANERINQLNREKGYIVDQLNTKYNTINTIMSAAQTDYANAKDLYDTQFSQKVQATNMLLNIDAAQQTSEQRAKDDARANVSIVTNALSSGALTWDNLDPATQSQYTKLEIQAGLPTGTIQAFASQGNEWEMSTVLPGVDQDGNAIATILQKNKATGEFKTTKLITDYAPASKGVKADVLQQGTYVDANNNEVAWTKYADGTVEQTALGQAKLSNEAMNADEKAENDFNKAVADIVEKMYLKGSDLQPLLSDDAAIATLKAQYPSITDSMARDFLGL